MQLKMGTKPYVLFVISVAALLHGIEALRCLQTDGKGPKKNAPCIFPFKYKKVVHYDCTNVADPDGKFWCSTKVDNKGKHVTSAGEWGYCADGCEEFPDSSEEEDIPKKGETGKDKTSEDGTYLPTGISQCGIRLAYGFIVGGVESKQGDFPFIALLGYDQPNGIRIYGCGGTLINRRYVVTAAHCQNKRNQIVEVVLGEHDVAQDPDCPTCLPVQKFDISNRDIIVHEGFDPKTFSSEGNDIALIRLPRLAETVNENSDQFVLPVCLPLKPDEPPEDSEYVVMGWGRTNNERSDSGNLTVTGSFVNIQQSLVVPEVPFEKCRQFDSFQKISRGIHICFGGEEGKDSCKGDSGGPLVSRRKGAQLNDPMYLVGIVSFGTTKCGSGTPGVYTSVKHYMNWIIDNLKP